MEYKGKPTNQLKAALIIIALMFAVVGGFVVYVWPFHRAIL